LLLSVNPQKQTAIQILSPSSAWTKVVAFRVGIYSPVPPTMATTTSPTQVLQGWLERRTGGTFKGSSSFPFVKRRVSTAPWARWVERMKEE
jgi:hypothetical protein